MNQATPTQPRTPELAQDGVALRISLKLTREECARLQRQNGEEKQAIEQLQCQLKQFKEEIKRENKNHHVFMAEEATKHSAQMDEARLEFSVAKVKLEEARNREITSKLLSLRKQVKSLQAVQQDTVIDAGDIKSHISTAQKKVHELLAFVPDPEAERLLKLEVALEATLKGLPEAPSVERDLFQPSVSEAVSFEIGDEPNSLSIQRPIQKELATQCNSRSTIVIPDRMVRSLKWINQCLHP
jgi:chromosome segregation ATPase